MDSPTSSITVLTEYFHPEEAATAQLLTALATDLTEDFDVSVVTAYPNYHDEDRNVAVPKQSVHEGVSIRRVRATRFNKDNIFLRVINWLSFAFLVTLHLIRSVDSDEVVLVLSNPPILPLTTWLLKRIKGTPYAYLIYDMYPDMPIGLDVISEDGIIARIWERAIRSVYRDADRIVVLGGSMERRLTEKMSDDTAFDAEKIEVIPNWEDGDFIQPVSKSENEFAREHDLVEPFVLLYSGNIGRYHELRTAIDAIHHLEQQGRTDIELLVIGEGGRKAEHQQYVARNNIENVRFLPFQPKERLPETLTACDASLVGITPEMQGICVSSKLYSALAAGRPVLAVVAENDEVAAVVQEAECGAHVLPGDATQAAEVLTAWADNPSMVAELGANARDCFETEYTRDHAVAAYKDLFARMHDGS